MPENQKIPPEILEKLDELMHEAGCYNDAMRYATDDFQDNLSGAYVSFYAAKINEINKKNQRNLLNPCANLPPYFEFFCFYVKILLDS